MNLQLWNWSAIASAGKDGSFSLATAQVLEPTYLWTLEYRFGAMKQDWPLQSPILKHPVLAVGLNLGDEDHRLLVVLDGV